MGRSKLWLSVLMSGWLGACASSPQSTAQTVVPAADDAGLVCDGSPVIRGEHIAAVEPLWTPNTLVKSPSHRLGGVIVELRPVDGLSREQLQQAVDCRLACAPRPASGDLLALAGVQATVDASDGHLAVILRADDPGALRDAMLRAEQLMRQAPR